MTFLETRNSKETQAAPYILDIYAGFGSGGNSGAISVNAGTYNAGEVVTLKIPYRGQKTTPNKIISLCSCSPLWSIKFLDHPDFGKMYSLQTEYTVPTKELLANNSAVQNGAKAVNHYFEFEVLYEESENQAWLIDPDDTMAFKNPMCLSAIVQVNLTINLGI